MNNIYDCAKFEDNQSKQSGLRVHTNLTMGGGNLGKKMVHVNCLFFLKSGPKKT